MEKKINKSEWAVGGGLILGLGAGLFFLPNGIAFVACMLIGLGLGLVVTSLISRK